MNSNARIPDNCVLCDKVVIESYWFPIESLRCCHQQYCADCLGLVAWCPKCHQFLGPKRKNGASRGSFAKPIPSLSIVEVLEKSTPNAEVNNFHEDFHDDEDCVIIEDESEGNSNKSPKKRKEDVNNNDDCILIEDDLDEVIPPVLQPRKSILKNNKCATSLQQSSRKKRKIDVNNNDDIIIIDDEPDERIPPVTIPQRRSILKKSRTLRSTFCPCFPNTSQFMNREAVRSALREFIKTETELPTINHIILLGTEFAGKSTVMKIIKSNFDSDWPDKNEARRGTNEIRKYLFGLIENIAKKNLEVNRINSSDSFSAQFVISAAKNLTQPRNRDNIETVLEKSLPFMTSQSLWFTIQEMDEEHKYFEKFFLAQYQRIISDSFYPTTEDLLKIYSPTVGGETFKINLEDTAATLITDVGGSLCERARWLQYLKNTGQIMFVIAVDEFDEKRRDGLNKLFYAASLFYQTIRIFGLPKFGGRIRRSFRPIVVLNKCDLLQKKLNAGVNFSEHHPEFENKGRPTLAEVLDWVKERFTDAMERHVDEMIESGDILAAPDTRVTFFELSAHDQLSRLDFIDNFIKNMKWENNMETIDALDVYDSENSSKAVEEALKLIESELEEDFRKSLQ